MEKTAVEWLVEQISSSKYFYNLMEDINSRSTIAQSDIIEQAKEMEKEQIIQARTTAPIIPTIDMIDYVKEAEQYYNEQYGKQQ